MVDFVSWLQSLEPELILFLMTFAAFGGGVFLMHYFFGKAGLYAFQAISVVLPGIQMLKVVYFPLLSDSFLSGGNSAIALGTAVFAANFLITDIFSELYGKDDAKRAVKIGFSIVLLWNVFVILTLGYTPVTEANPHGAEGWQIPMHNTLSAIFMPFPMFAVAGIIAYITSQYTDILLFEKIRNKTGEGKLWLRNIGSTSISTLVDNTVFSVMAWIVLPMVPFIGVPDMQMEFAKVFAMYIIGFWWLRIGFALLDTPFIYLAKKFGTIAHQ